LEEIDQTRQLLSKLCRIADEVVNDSSRCGHRRRCGFPEIEEGIATLLESGSLILKM
jgi:hypothetical protein